MNFSNSSLPASPTVQRSNSSMLTSSSLHTSTNSDLKVRRMTLFANGLCNYELSSKVVGDATLSLTVRATDMSRLLSSLTVVDLSGRGIISSISYESPGYVETMQKEIGPGLGASQRSYLSLLRNAVGTKISIEKGGSSSRKAPLEGTLLGVENGIGKTENTLSLVLLIEALEVRCVDVPDVKYLRFHNSEIHKQFAMFTAYKSRKRSEEKKRVVITAKGEGVRSISANFLAAMPVWKTSYRFLISPSSLLIQGWAVIDNATDQDLENVELTLVSEAPMPLSRNLYMPQKKGSMSGAREDLSQMRRRLTGTDGDESDTERRESALAASPASSQANGMESAANGDQHLSASGSLMQTQNYEHKIASTVSIRRFHSALVPVIFSECYGGRIGLYNAENCLDRVLSAVQLLNSTKKVLEAGPVTIFDDGSYVGEAVLPRCLPDQREFLPYSTDKSFSAAKPEISEKSVITGVNVVDGKMVVSRSVTRTTKYHLTNMRAFETDLYVEHNLKREDYTITSSMIDGNKSIKHRSIKGRVVQYIVHFMPEKSITLVIEEQNSASKSDGNGSETQEVESSLSNLAELSEKDIGTLVDEKKISDTTVKALRDLLTSCRTLLTTKKRAGRLQSDEKRLKDREAAAQRNLASAQAIDGSEGGDAKARCLRKVDALDDELEKVYQQRRLVEDAIEKAKTEIEESMRSFSTDTDSS